MESISKLNHRFFFGRIFRRQIFALMLAKSVFFFVMVAANWSQIFVLSQKNGRGILDFIFLVAKKVKIVIELVVIPVLQLLPNMDDS